MSWGATAYTPIVTENVPPFGFAENPNPPDFKTCNVNPWATGDQLREDIQSKLLIDAARRQLSLDRTDLNDTINYQKAHELRCNSHRVPCNSLYETFSNAIYPNNNTFTLIVLILLIAYVYYVYNR